MTLRDAAADARAIRLGAVLVLLAGFFFVFRGDQHRIETQLGANAQLAARIRDDETTLARAGVLSAERDKARRRVARYALRSTATDAVAMFLRDAAAIAASHHTALTAIAAVRRAAPAPDATPASDGFDEMPLDVTLEGRYDDVLATVRDLSSARVLASVDVVSLARKNLASQDPTLRTALHVVVARFRTSDAGAGSS